MTGRTQLPVHATVMDDVVLAARCRKCDSRWFMSLGAFRAVATLMEEMDVHPCRMNASPLSQLRIITYEVMMNGATILEVTR